MEPSQEQVCWQDVRPYKFPAPEQPVPKDRPHGRDTQWAACEELQPVGRTHADEVHGGCFPWEGPHGVAGEQVEESALGSREWQR